MPGLWSAPRVAVSSPAAGSGSGPAPAACPLAPGLGRGRAWAVLDLLHSERFVDQAPTQVCAALLDEDRYLCSVRTMYRILDANQEVGERRTAPHSSNCAASRRSSTNACSAMSTGSDLSTPRRTAVVPAAVPRIQRRHQQPQTLTTHFISGTATVGLHAPKRDGTGSLQYGHPPYRYMREADGDACHP